MTESRALILTFVSIEGKFDGMARKGRIK